MTLIKKSIDLIESVTRCLTKRDYGRLQIPDLSPGGGCVGHVHTRKKVGADANNHYDLYAFKMKDSKRLRTSSPDPDGGAYGSYE